MNDKDRPVYEYFQHTCNYIEISLSRWIENIFVDWKFYILGQKGTKMEN